MNDRAPMKIAYIRPLKRLSAETQKDAAIREGYSPDRWIIEGRGGMGIKDLIGTTEEGAPPILRKGYWLGVYRYELVADRKRKKGDRAPRETLNEVTDALRKIGVVVQEFETGRNCKSGDDMLDMYKDAISALAGDKRQQAGPGRPKEHNYSDADCQLIQAAWHGSEVRNPAGRTASVRALLGEDGKPRFPKFKQSTWYSLREHGRVK